MPDDNPFENYQSPGVGGSDATTGPTGTTPPGNNALVFGIVSASSVLLGIGLGCLCGGLLEIPLGSLGIVLGVMAWTSANATLRAAPSDNQRSQAQWAKLLAIFGIVSHVLLVIAVALLLALGFGAFFMHQL